MLKDIVLYIYIYINIYIYIYIVVAYPSIYIYNTQSILYIVHGGSNYKSVSRVNAGSVRLIHDSKHFNHNTVGI